MEGLPWDLQEPKEEALLLSRDLEQAAEGAQEWLGTRKGAPCPQISALQ